MKLKLERSNVFSFKPNNQLYIFVYGMCYYTLPHNTSCEYRLESRNCDCGELSITK